MLRDQFFILFKDIKVAHRYYCRYTTSSVIWNNIISGICFLASAVTISSWVLWESVPFAWTIVIAASQVFAALRPLLKSSGRLSAAKYLLPEMEQLIDDLSGTWDELNYVREFSESELHEVIQQYRKRYTDTREKYAPSELFPEKKWLRNQAERDTGTFFSVNYNASREDDIT